MFHLGEIAVLTLASLWLVEGRDYEVLRNNSGYCYLHFVFLVLVLVRAQSYDHDIVDFKAFSYSNILSSYTALVIVVKLNC